MTLLQTLALTVVLSASATSLASDTSRGLAADNVVRCQAKTGCFNKVLFGRTYKVITTPRFTVMLSVSKEGVYTRADLSIANTSGSPLSLSPGDFRIEVVSPKDKVLAYIPFADLRDIAPAPPIPAVTEIPSPAASSTATLSIDELYTRAKAHEAEQLAADRAAALQPVASSVVAADQVVRGRVYFDQDKHARDVTVILPIAGQVFEFPYTMQ